MRFLTYVDGGGRKGEDVLSKYGSRAAAVGR